MKTTIASWKYFKPIFEYERKYGQLESTWIGHRYFAYDLIRNLEPRSVVELGTFKGGSLFSFAQAIKDGNIDTVVYGVDTWLGDKQAGSLNDSDYDRVIKIKDTIYKSVKIKLLRLTFNEAVSKFPDKSIDMLHFDGLHTLEAITEDFETWKNKLSPGGVLLFHDTHEKHDDFGVYKFWGEIKQEFPSVDFYHEHGLGVLFTSKHLPMPLESMWPTYYAALDSSNKNNVENKLLKSRIKALQKNVNDYKIILEQIKRAKFFRLWQSLNRLKKVLIPNNNI